MIKLKKKKIHGSIYNLIKKLRIIIFKDNLILDEKIKKNRVIKE